VYSENAMRDQPPTHHTRPLHYSALLGDAPAL
jgi:hypothetical protein